MQFDLTPMFVQCIDSVLLLSHLAFLTARVVDLSLHLISSSITALIGNNLAKPNVMPKQCCHKNKQIKVNKLIHTNQYIILVTINI